MKIDITTIQVIVAIISYILGTVCGFGIAAIVNKIIISIRAEKLLKEIINKKPALKSELLNDYSKMQKANTDIYICNINNNLLKETKNIHDKNLHKYLDEIFINNSKKGKERFLVNFFASL